jgi:hypothetical protein
MHVDTYFLATFTSKEFPDRRIIEFPFNIPESDIDCAEGPMKRSSTMMIVTIDILPVVINPHRILTQEILS